MQTRLKYTNIYLSNVQSLFVTVSEEVNALFNRLRDVPLRQDGATEDVVEECLHNEQTKPWKVEVTSIRGDKLVAYAEACSYDCAAELAERLSLQLCFTRGETVQGSIIGPS